MLFKYPVATVCSLDDEICQACRAFQPRMYVERSTLSQMSITDQG